MFYIIFDFDGTIADTSEAFRQIFNQLSKKYHFKPINKELIPALKIFPARKAIKMMGFNPFLFPFILNESSKLLGQKIHTINLAHNQLKKCLLKLASTPKIVLTVLSSNSVKNIKRFLEHYEIDCFTTIQSTSSLWNKAYYLKKLMIKHKLNSNKVIYIGDECRDIDAAKKAGIKIAAVSWGYNDRSTLLAQSPDYIIDHPDDLAALINNIR